MPRLSVIVIALNQEANIGDCLASVSFADEIVVVDTGSTDRTVELARAYTDRVLTAPWQGFGRTKNFALDQARGEWVFSLDTDERVPPALQEEILAVVEADGPLNGYRVAPEKLFLRPLDQASGLVPRLHPAPLSPGPGPLSGPGGPRGGGGGRARGGFADAAVCITATGASANTSPAWTGTPAWRRRNWPRRAGAPFRENYSSGPFSPFSISISSGGGFWRGRRDIPWRCS